MLKDTVEQITKNMKNYDPQKLSKYIKYLDKNDLCGWAMSRYLPYGGFKWLKNVDNFVVNSTCECISIENSSMGYIVKVDLEYPDELHYLHNDYPLAPEKLAISYDMLSYCKKNAGKYGIKVGDVKKLAPNLGDKTNYIVHYENLHLYLSLGIKLPKFIMF